MDPNAGDLEGDAEPRWLSTDEQAAWRQLVHLLFRLPSALDAELQRDAGISSFEYMVLSGLSEAENRTLRMSDLAVMAAGSLSRLSHVVSRLEKRGWVRREPCPGDGRFVNAVLTDDGWDKVVATAPSHVESVRRLVVDVLSARDLSALGGACGQILDVLARE
jgi:DNA-binding MarR family transcriptional regulator